MNTLHILHLDASPRQERSVSRHLSQKTLEALQLRYPMSKVRTRDISQGLPFLDEFMIQSMDLPGPERSPTQRAVLDLSNVLVDELRVSDILVLGMPLYNFAMPATFKAYADLIAREHRTFENTRNGARGLLEDKKIYVLIASECTEQNSEADFLTPWLRHFFSFLGIDTPLEIIMVKGVESVDPPGQRLKKAYEEIKSLVQACPFKAETEQV